MRRSYTKIYSRILLLAVAMLMSFSIVANSQIQKTDTTYLHLNRLKKDKNVLKNFHVNLPVIKTYGSLPAKTVVTSSPDDKLLTNVQVYPNPVTDQINLKYTISRPSNVNIKIMDVLGNEVVTLFSQHVDKGGEQKFTSSISNKMNSGFYFVRIVVGTESAIRRISIL
ncbi:T9SS type A sorting domain-containing protein [Mucilaginibacter mali]|uniref:T9SS type A sorting domain-containing protein n=1 Tax=Mucilaginibacter mali TaxID=2740462 RepID=A0A7D4PSB1_9SPHI|nr:T9SS type A sorting domain-containing protein [Mucilaginibacter mali]QKJ28908.1 T9SS type A sorting domain-containing protein [Mucilaginibacter mali]